MTKLSDISKLDFEEGFKHISTVAKQTMQRPLVWVSGDRDAVFPIIGAITDESGSTNTIYVSKSFAGPALEEVDLFAQKGISICKHKSHLLGTQCDYLIYDGFDGFDPDLFCIASGTLKAGGLLFLVTPDSTAWIEEGDADYEKMVVYPHKIEDVESRFIQRLLIQITLADFVSHWACQQTRWERLTPEALPVSSIINAKSSNSDEVIYTADQLTVMDSVSKVVSGHRNRPLVVTADRGRGKSAAIGAALSKLEGPSYVVVTAPNFDNVKVLFEHFSKNFPGPRVNAKRIEHAKLKIEYLSPDELLLLKEKPTLVVVDEAAAIPEGLLKAYLSIFHRMVFATTVHGYEGTGKGFQIRFEPYLHDQCPGFKKLVLNQPMRWGEEDCLESWLNETFLLSAEYEIPHVLEDIDTESLDVTAINQQTLSESPEILKQVFGLLVQAHYRTSPGDLRDLLDALNFKIWLLKSEDHLLGCCLIAEEGSMDSEIVDDIESGVRRPRGHLLPQALCQQIGEKQFATKKIARVVRIAVLPKFQGAGLGSNLLKRVEQYYLQKDFEAIGSSFSAHPNVIRYWFKNNYSMMRLGFSKEASSGAHSLLTMKSLKGEFGSLAPLSLRFLHEFLYLLGSEFRALPNDVVLAILDSFPQQQEEKIGFSQSSEMVVRFIEGARTFESARFALWQYLLASIPTKGFSDLVEVDRVFLVELLLKQTTFKALQQEKLLTGKKQGVEKLRAIFSSLYIDTKTVIQPTS